jgi:hypothetical protein
VSYLDITSPAELHAAVDVARSAPRTVERKRWEDQSDAHMVASAEARRYAPHNQELTRDAWVTRVLTYLNDTDRVRSGTDALLELGKAYIVLVGNQYAVTRSDKTWRLAFPLPENGGALFEPHQGKCDYCWLSESVALGRAASRWVEPVHVARFGFVAEFHLCDECRRTLLTDGGVSVVVAKPGPV